MCTIGHLIFSRGNGPFQHPGPGASAWVRLYASTVEKANALGVMGYAMDHPDGSVWIEAEGRRDGLMALLE